MVADTLVNGDVYSTGPLTMEHNASILGSAYANGDIITQFVSNTIGGGAVMAGSFTGDSGQVGGTLEEFVSPDPVKTMPCDPWDIDAIYANEAQPIQGSNDNGELNPSYYDSASQEYHLQAATDTMGVSGQDKEYYFTVFDVADGGNLTIQGNVKIYCDVGDFKLRGNGTVTLAAGATLTVYTSNKFRCDAFTQFNNPGRPQNLIIYSDFDDATIGGSSIKIDGRATFVGIIYAPKTACRLAKDGTFRGSIRGRYVRFEGDTNFYYDEDLSDLFALPDDSFRVAIKRHF